MQVPLRRPQDPESTPQEILTLAQAHFWPVEFPNNIDAPSDMPAKDPYTVNSYPTYDVFPYPLQPEFRGWNGHTLAENKADPT